jgi:hypothetical protein
MESTLNYSPKKPGPLTAVGVMTLVNGIINIFWGLIGTGATILGTIGFGLLCAPVTILPTVLGIVEVIYGIRLLADPIKRGTRPSTALAIMQILCVFWLNFLSPIVGILALVFYNDAAVKEYFQQVNS